MKLVFNELCLSSEKIENKHVAQLKMNDFIELCRKAISKGNERKLFTTTIFENQELTDGYTFHSWMNDNEVSRDAQRYLRSLLTRAYELSQEENEIRQTMLEYDFVYSTQNANGLGFAYLSNGLAISLNTSSEWNTHEIRLEKSYIDSESGEITIENVEVIHANNLSHLDIHNEWYISSKKIMCTSGLNLWDRREEIFPNLIFCENSKKHIKTILSKTTLLDSIVKKLFDLDTYADSWTDGGFDQNQIRGKITPDSPQTLRQYGSERTFVFPDGREELFNWHSRVTPDAWRIFFHPDSSTRKIVIGHIGPKLPTVKDN